MNVVCEPGAEERSCGSGAIGKTVFSMADDKLALVTYVPVDKCEQMSATEWLMNTVTEIIMSGNGQTTKADATEQASQLVSSYPGNEKTFARATIIKNADAGLFPLKMKDQAINSAYALLKCRGLFPDGKDDDSDDDYCFGDDDFPSM